MMTVRNQGSRVSHQEDAWRNLALAALRTLALANGPLSAN